MTLDADFGAKLRSVLSDPEAMAKISAIASSLGSPSDSSKPDPAPSAPAEDIGTAPEKDAFSAFQQLSQLNPQLDDPRLALLCSLKPLLREEKRDRIDALTRALTLAAMMKNFRK